MIAEADQLIRTFNAILMISRLEAGSSGEPLASLELDAILRDVVELYEPLAEEEKVELIHEGGGAPVAVQGNRELIGHALSNILDTAIKYSAGAVDAPCIRLTLEEGDSEIRLSVVDNGPGIEAEDRERVTERFVRLEQSRSRPGSGLGLALAKAVMQFHGGRLELGSEGEGLAVSMVFPRPEAST